MRNWDTDYRKLQMVKKYIKDPSLWALVGLVITITYIIVKK